LRTFLAPKLVIAALAFVVALSAPRASASRSDADVPTTVKMSCEKIGQPGRVRCEVEARVASGTVIRWGDVEITSVPAFVTPLRGRIGPREATTREDDAWRWAFALAAREKGTGDVQARVRLVTCVGTKCAPRQLPVTAKVQVGD
jgi:hypothetical protein